VIAAERGARLRICLRLLVGQSGINVGCDYYRFGNRLC